MTLDIELKAALLDDYRTAPISAAETRMLDYAVAITRDPTQISRDDHDQLRAHGFTPVAILQMTLIAAWFNYINRVADALGVGREPAAASAGAAEVTHSDALV